MKKTSTMKAYHMKRVLLALALIAGFGTIAVAQTYRPLTNTKLIINSTYPSGNALTLQTGAGQAAYTLTLPASAPTGGYILRSDPGVGSANTLIWTGPMDMYEFVNGLTETGGANNTVKWGGDLTGATTINTAGANAITFYNNTGATTAAMTIGGGSGTLTLDVRGATTINTSGSAATSIGNTDGTFTLLSSTGLNVTAAGVITDGDGDVVVDDNLVPNVHDNNTLGANAARWSDVFIGPSTLHIGTTTAGGDELALSYNTTDNKAIFNVGSTNTMELTSAALTLSANLVANGNTTLGNTAADVLAFNGTIAGASPLVFEGATDGDGFQTTFAISGPTADRTITFPDVSGTVYTTGNTDDLLWKVGGNTITGASTTRKIGINSQGASDDGIAITTDGADRLTITSTGDATFAEALAVTGAFTANGSVTLGNSDGGTDIISVQSANGLIVNTDLNGDTDANLTIAQGSIIRAGSLAIQGENAGVSSDIVLTDNIVANTTNDIELNAGGFGSIKVEGGASEVAELKVDLTGSFFMINDGDGGPLITLNDGVGKGTIGLSGDRIELSTDGNLRFDISSDGTATFAENTVVGGILSVTDATNSTSTTTGALVVSGGVGIASDVYIGGATNLTSTLDVTGNTSLTGDLTANGSVTLGNSDATDVVSVQSTNGLIINTDLNGDTDANLTIAQGSIIRAGSLAIQGEDTGVSSEIILTNNIVATTTNDIELNAGGFGSINVEGGSGEIAELKVDLTGSVFKIDDGDGGPILTLTDGVGKGTIGLSGDRIELSTDGNLRFDISSDGTSTFAGDIVAANLQTDGTSSHSVVVSDAGTLRTATVGTLLGGSFWAFDGNTTGATKTIGSNDAYSVGIETNGTTWVTINSDGATTLDGSVTLGDAAADIITISGTIAGASPLVFEGATDGDGFQTTFAISGPSADQTITFPDETGTVVLTAGTQAIGGAKTFNDITTFAGDIMAANLQTDGTSSHRIVVSDAGTLRTATVGTLLGGSFWAFDGNTTGATKTIGSNDAYSVGIETNNTTWVTINSDGATTLDGSVTLGDAAADIITISGTIAGASPLVFEGATDGDGFQTTFAISGPSADQTITFPDETGTVVLTAGTQAIGGAKTFNDITTFAGDIMAANLQTDGTSSHSIVVSDAGTLRTATVGTLLGGSFWALDGNTTGGTKTIGSNDAYTVGIETNNSTRLTINSDGDATFSHTLTSTGNLTVGSSTFTVAAATGNTVVNGSLTLGTSSSQASLYLFDNTGGQKGLIQTSGLTSDRTYTIDVNSDASFVMTKGAQTIDGAKTFGNVTTFSQGMKLPITVATAGATYAADDDDMVIIQTAVQQVTFPTGATGRIIIVKNTSGSNITLSAGADTFEGGAATLSLATATSQTFIYSGGVWYLIGN